MKWRVDPDEAGKKLLVYLREKCGKYHSVKLLKRAIDAKRCSVNGRVERLANVKLERADLVELDLSKMSELTAHQTFTCTPLYEDADLLVLNKPAGLICEDPRLNALLPTYGGKLLLIHRLDKETSGALLLAKSPKAKASMIDLFKNKEIIKIYLALVDGRVSQKAGKIESYLVRKQKISGQNIWGSNKQGRAHERAITFWKRQHVADEVSLLLCQLITGRTHQLRVHLSEMGHPILGDFQYGKKFTCHFRPKRHLLHAYILRFQHPWTQKEIEIKAPLPRDFVEVYELYFNR